MKSFASVLLIALLAATVTLQAATITAYESGIAPATGAAPAADPATQGWAFNSGTVVGNQYAAGYDSGNGGWRTVDGTSSAPAFYQNNISADTMPYGWTFTAVLSMDSDAVGSAGGFVNDYYMPPNNGRQGDIHIWIETVNDKSYAIQLTIDADSNLWGNDGTTNHQLTTDGSAYDTFKTLTIDYNGASATLTCGTTTVAIADRNLHSQNRVVFGAASSSSQGSVIWNSVKLDAPVVFYDDFSYGTTQGALDFGWEQLSAGNGWGVDGGPLWGNLMILRYITDTVIEAGSEVTIEIDRNREGSGYTYSGDLIAWNGTTATVLESYSFAGGSDPATKTFAPISGAYAGQQLGFTFSHSNAWGETLSIKLTSVTLSNEPYARNPNPQNGAINVSVTTDLNWLAPSLVTAASYDVFLDPNESDLTTAAEFYSPAQTGTSFVPSVDLDWGTNYYWRVDVHEPNDAVHTGYVWSFSTPSPDPQITQQPEKQLVFAGETAEFSISATNPFTQDSTGLSYQWYKVGDPDIELTTDTNLTIADAQVEDGGEYYCMVTVDEPPAGVTSTPTRSHTVKLIIKRLLGNWQFENNLLDSSGNGYDGAAYGSPSYGAIPADDPSRQVNGKALHCTVGGAGWASLPATVFDEVDTQVTISLWTWGVDQPNEGNQYTFIVKNGSGTAIASMMIPHSTARIPTYMGNGDTGTDGWYEGSSAPNKWFNGQWNHWVITKDSEAGIMRVYRNGQLHLESTSAYKPFYGASTFYVGGNNDGAGAFGGYIDDVRVYNYALSAEEIAAIHPRPLFPQPEDGQTNIDYSPTLSWTPGDGTTTYKLHISNTLNPDPNIYLTDPVTVVGLTEPSTTLPINLDLEDTYYWYVEEFNSISTEPVWTSELWNFKVRQLVADIDDNSAVIADDLAQMATRWTDDVRGTPEPVLMDSGTGYDPNDGYLPQDPANYAYYWQTYWTATGGEPGSSEGGNNLYGTGYCEPVTNPEPAIAWHYDTPSSTGKTDTVMWYYHGERPSAPIPLFDELRVEVKAAPGSTIKDNPYTWIGDANDNWVGYTFSGITALLSDNKWHELVWPLRAISGTASMGNFLEFDVGYWGSNLTGTFYFRNARLINNEGTVMCLPMYYIPEDVNTDCLVDMNDLAIMATEWLMDARNP